MRDGTLQAGLCRADWGVSQGQGRSRCHHSNRISDASERLHKEEISDDRSTVIEGIVAERSTDDIQKHKERDIGWNDAAEAPSVKLFERNRLSAKIQQDRCNQKSRKNKEEIDSDPAELWKAPELAGEYCIVAPNHQQNGDTTEPVEFRYSLHVLRSYHRRF